MRTLKILALVSLLVGLALALPRQKRESEAERDRQRLTELHKERRELAVILEDPQKYVLSPERDRFNQTWREIAEILDRHPDWPNPDTEYTGKMEP